MAGSPLSANVLREVRLRDGSLAVLKLIGEPQSAEAATLAAWTVHRVPCAPLLDHGVGTHAPDVTHLLLGKVPGTALPHTEMAPATAQVVRLFQQAHLKPPAEVEPLHDFLVLGPATQFARTTAMYGQTIEHGPLQAYAHGVLAYLAYWDGRPTAAMRNIHIAKSFGGVGSTGHMRLSAIEARAYAHLGRHRDAERAVQQALAPGPDMRDELHDDVGGEFAFGPARAAMSHATTYLLLKDSQRAEQSALHALQLLDEDPRADRPVQMQVTVDLARARLLRGELDGADEALEPVLATPVEWRTIGLVDRVTQLRGELARPQLEQAPAARTLAEQIEDFVARATARPLPGSRLAIEG
ncbi:hypothetical protein [Streptomyces sp. NPDC057889]|uniref:hypothetical protein n=1 Tax=unclassified Streptomyces TaxID=2593676 RepID=UPI0036C1B683